MKLASVALVAGGAVFGSQLGEVRVHEEVRTKSLVIQGEGGDVVFTPSFGGGLSIKLGEGSKYGSAVLELGVDAGGWKMELRNEHGASVRARVVDETAELVVAGDEGGARLDLVSSNSRQEGAPGWAHIGIMGEPRNGTHATNHAVTIGVKGGSGRLTVSHRVETGMEFDGLEIDTWESLLHVSEDSSTGPWEAPK